MVQKKTHSICLGLIFTNHHTLLENCDFSTNEDPVDLKPVSMLEFFLCGQKKMQRRDSAALYVPVVIVVVEFGIVDVVDIVAAVVVDNVVVVPCLLLLITIYLVVAKKCYSEAPKGC